MNKTIYLLLLFTFYSNAQTKILFDATKAEMAGNADWVIDADAHNIWFSSTTHLPYTSSSGGASNPQRIPTPAQSGITATTPETFWQGSLSNFAIDCVNQGYIVESLPYNSAITYGNSANAQDLSNYKVFVVDEPNSSFTALEKAALVNFVANGGGLMMISDHTISDRNNDGVDSPMVWNDFMTSNTVQNNPFGITFDLLNISGNSSTFANLPTNSILHGSHGNVTQVLWTNGTTMTLNIANNSTVRGLVYKSGSSTTGTTNVMVASASYLQGKVIAIGDSSIPDDGTGDTGDTLYNGYTGDANGNHQKLLMNAMVWLATPTLSNSEFNANAIQFNIAPNPVQGKELRFNFTTNTDAPVTLFIYDTLGRIIKTVTYKGIPTENNLKTLPIDELVSGIYICKLSNIEQSKSIRFIVK
jgi:hypothetical protein